MGFLVSSMQIIVEVMVLKVTKIDTIFDQRGQWFTGKCFDVWLQVNGRALIPPPKLLGV